jgi:dynein intermediate chain
MSKSPELFLASYSQSFEASSNDSQGVVLVWSSTLKTRPEFSFFCQTSVTSAKFNPFASSVIVGGTYSGQLILWDVRTKSIPVQKSGMASGHAHPIFSLGMY